MELSLIITVDQLGGVVDLKEVTLSKIRKALPEAAVKELCQLYELLDGGMNRGDVDADAVSVKPDEKADI